MKVSTKSFDTSLSTGLVAKSDFKKDGFVIVNFYKRKTFVGVEVAGVCHDSFNYYLNPKNNKQIVLNDLFIKRYVDKCENASEIKKQLFN